MAEVPEAPGEAGGKITRSSREQAHKRGGVGGGGGGGGVDRCGGRAPAEIPVSGKQKIR